MKTTRKAFYRSLIAVSLVSLYAIYHQVSDTAKEVQFEETSSTPERSSAFEVKTQFKDFKIIYQVYSGGKVNDDAVTSIQGRLIEMRPSVSGNKRYWYMENPVISLGSGSQDVKTIADLTREAISGSLTVYDNAQVLEQINGSNFWQSLLSKIQMYPPSDAFSLEWRQTEKSSYGLVDAIYKKTQGHKIINGEFAFNKSYAFRPQPQLDVNYHCDGNWLLANSIYSKLECNEFLTFSGTKVETLIRNEISISMQKLEPLSEDDYKIIKRIETSSMAYRSKPKQVEMQKKIIGEKNLDDIFALIDLEGENERDADAYLNIKAWIYLHSSQLGEFYERIKDLQTNDPKFRLALRALMGVGSRESQLVLNSLLKDSLGSDTLRAQSVIGAMALVKEPILESETALRELSTTHQDKLIRKSSSLALAAMGSKLNQGDGDAKSRYQKILEDFTVQLKNASSQSQIIDLLSAIGNLGSEDCLELLSSYTRSDNPTIAAVALFSLRLIPSDKAKQMLFSAKEHSVGGVRLKAAKALSFQSLSEAELNSIARWLSEDADISVRRQLLLNLTDQVNRHPRLVTDLVSSLVDSEKDPYIQSQMRKVLAEG